MYQAFRLRVMVWFLEVACNALFQVLGLADVDNGAFGVFEEIASGEVGESIEGDHDLRKLLILDYFIVTQRMYLILIFAQNYLYENSYKKIKWISIFQRCNRKVP